MAWARTAASWSTVGVSAREGPPFPRGLASSPGERTRPSRCVLSGTGRYMHVPVYRVQVSILPGLTERAERVNQSHRRAPQVCITEARCGKSGPRAARIRERIGEKNEEGRDGLPRGSGTPTVLHGCPRDVSCRRSRAQTHMECDIAVPPGCPSRPPAARSNPVPRETGGPSSTGTFRECALYLSIMATIRPLTPPAFSFSRPSPISSNSISMISGLRSPDAIIW